MAYIYTYESAKKYLHLVTSDDWIQPWARLLDMFYMAQKSFVMMTRLNSATVNIYTTCVLRYIKHNVHLWKGALLYTIFIIET